MTDSPAYKGMLAWIMLKTLTGRGIMIKMRWVVLPAVLFSVVSGFLPAQEQELPRFAQEVVVRYWLVPVYAMNKDGSPAVDLKAEDLEVFVGGRKVERFDLHRKEFQLVPAAKPQAPAEKPAAPVPFQKKMVLLVFDSSFSTYNLLQKAKKVAEAMMAQEVQASQFVALSIEPFSGLKAVCGPTGDRELVARSLKAYVSGKKADYVTASAMDSSEIQRVYPADSRYADRNPDGIRSSRGSIKASEIIDTRNKKRLTASYVQALMTLNLILGYFKDNTKVVYLFSCGIPGSALETRVEYAAEAGGLATEPGVDSYMNISPDYVNLESLKRIGKVFNRNGSLLFLINPSGTRVAFSDKDSGEQSLRILADESGGRYYDGPEKDLAREIAAMESAYYEISFPDDKAYEGLDIDFEIMSRNSETSVYSVKRISRGKDYVDIKGLERQVLILNLLDDGPFAQTKLKVADTGSKSSKQGDHVFFEMTLPREIAVGSWDVYKVWRDKETGRIAMEEDRLPTGKFEVRIAMPWKKGYRHEIVMVHPQTGTTLISRL